MQLQYVLYWRIICSKREYVTCTVLYRKCKKEYGDSSFVFCFVTKLKISSQWWTRIRNRKLEKTKQQETIDN